MWSGATSMPGKCRVLSTAIGRTTHLVAYRARLSDGRTLDADHHGMERRYHLGCHTGCIRSTLRSLFLNNDLPEAAQGGWPSDHDS